MRAASTPVASWNAADQRYRDGYDWNKLLYSGENSITSYLSLIHI